MVRRINIAAKYSNLQSAKAKHYQTVYEHYGLFSGRTLKVVKHVEMPKAAPKKSICHFQKLEMILK